MRVRITITEMGVKQGAHTEALSRFLRRDHDGRIIDIVRGLRVNESVTLVADQAPNGELLSHHALTLATIEVLP